MRPVCVAATACLLIAVACACSAGDDPPTTTHYGAAAVPTTTRSSTGPGLGHVRGPRSYALPDPGRRLQSYTVRDTASGLSEQVLVDLPAGYRPSSRRTYPVVLGLIGFPMRPVAFTRVNFLSTADRLASRHELRPSIFVIPQVNNPERLDTECVNGPAGDPQTETWLVRELPGWVVRHFHARTDRQSWAALGYSFGGWCAAALSMRHPGVYGAAVVFSGYFEIEFGRRYHPLTRAQERSYDLVRLARTAPPPIAMWIFASREDHDAWPTTRRFLRAARPPMSVTAVIVATGGHHNRVFEPSTATALTWLAKTVSGFRPPARH